MDMQCEWLCWGGGSPSPHCCALPYLPGTLILHLNISPYLSPPFPKSSSPRLPPPHCTPSNSPSACPLCPFLKEQVPWPFSQQGSPEHVCPVPSCPQEQLPGSASQNLPPQKILLPLPPSLHPRAARHSFFPSWTGVVLGQRLPRPGGSQGDAGNWCLSSRSCAGRVHPPQNVLMGDRTLAPAFGQRLGCLRDAGTPAASETVAVLLATGFL